MAVNEQPYLAGVMLVFYGRIISGTSVVLESHENFNAFKNFHPAGYLGCRGIGGDVRINTRAWKDYVSFYKPLAKRSDELVVSDNFSGSEFFSVFENYSEKLPLFHRIIENDEIKAIIVHIHTGLSDLCLPSYRPNGIFRYRKELEAAQATGVHVIVTTDDSTNILSDTIDDPSGFARELGVIPAWHICPAALESKLMWMFGNKVQNGKFSYLFTKSLKGEFATTQETEFL